METSILIAAAASVAAVAIPLIFQEGIKEIIKKSLSDRSPQQVRRAFIILLVVLFVVVSGTGFGISASVADSNPAVEEETTAQTDAYQNDTIQAVVDLVKTTVDKTEEYIDNKRTRDSATLANREKRWVYRIGNSQDEESDAWDVAFQLMPLGDIYIFKQERKSYAVICDPVLDEEALRDSLAFYKAQIAALGLNYRVDVVNLMDYCSVKESVVETKTIERRKHDETFRCLSCEK